MSNQTAVHLGAGNVGRGFVASVLPASGYQVIFADVHDIVIAELQATDSPHAHEVGKGFSSSVVDNIRAIHSRTHEADVVAGIDAADVATSAAGARILQFIAPVIATGRDARLRAAAKQALIAARHRSDSDGPQADSEKKLIRISTPNLPATCERAGRTSTCKISRNEPFIWPKAERAELGMPADEIAVAIAGVESEHPLFPDLVQVIQLRLNR